MSLRTLPTEPELGTSTSRLIEQFYMPALSQSISYDRGVGYFTSAWLHMASSGLAQLASNSGKARFLASPMLTQDDCEAIARGVNARTDPILLRSLEKAIKDLEEDLESNTLVALAWMLADNILDFRIAIPTGDLDGDFHDKFGIFRDTDGNGVSFHGSQNDSQRAFRNYEAISIFYSWVDAREQLRVAKHQARFDRLWNNGDANLRVYEMPEAIRRNLLQYADKSPRPYTRPGGSTEDSISRKWRHQTEALQEFLAAKHGVLEMATGTGKTRTAIRILEELIARGQVSTAIVSAHGTDLLDQWHKELLRCGCSFLVRRAYNTHRDMQAHINDPRHSVLIVSRMNLADVLARLPNELLGKAMIICDEAHGMGSPSLVATLGGKISPFAYRLGLSATPEREYDEAGNSFIEAEIGPVIFQFDLQTAIERSILCPLDYVELEYEFSDEDKAAVAAAIRRYHAKQGTGQTTPKEDLFQEIARVKKLSKNKLPVFRQYIALDPTIAQRCLIFVETAEYGVLVQDLLMEHDVDFHTYYGDDDRQNLPRFATGELDCLITCHRISEGIDIQSVNNIVLFSSARARLETVQRVGRCLRADPNNPSKRAKVVDFIRTDDIEQKEALDESTADVDRRDWFRNLAKVQPKIEYIS